MQPEKIHKPGESTMKSKLMLTNHLVQKNSWGKALESNFMESIWAGEWENVEKIVEVKRGGPSKNIH